MIVFTDRALYNTFDKISCLLNTPPIKITQLLAKTQCVISEFSGTSKVLKTKMPGAPPPPPPFPPITTQLSPKTAPRNHYLPYENENLWARDFIEIQKACYFSNSKICSKPKSCTYYEIPSILQIGPTCGLTAVSMMLLGSPPPHEILAAAKSRKFTKFGEMFSTENLREIIKEVAPEHVKSCILSGNIDCEDFRSEMVAGNVALVTYLCWLAFVYVDKS